MICNIGEVREKKIPKKVQNCKLPDYVKVLPSNQLYCGL